MIGFTERERERERKGFWNQNQNQDEGGIDVCTYVEKKGEGLRCFHLTWV